MDAAADPREVEMLQAYLNDYGQQAEIFSRQLEILEEGRLEALAAIESLNELDGAMGGTVLLQIGGGASVRVTVKDAGRVLLNIGSGVVVERGRAEAVSYLGDRVTEMEASSKRISETIEKIQGQMNEIAKRLDQISRQQQATASPSRNG